MPARTLQKNTPRTGLKGRRLDWIFNSFHLKKDTPKRIASEILSLYGKWIQPGEESIDFFETDLSKRIEARLTPGKWLKHLREANGLSQRELGVMLGEAKPVRPARISDWESDFRGISKPIAKKLAAIFHVPAEKFI